MGRIGVPEWAIIIITASCTFWALHALTTLHEAIIAARCY